jgi:hypothetical protein
MSQDYTTRLRELAEEMYQEESRIQGVGRALADAEIRRVNALRQAREWLDRAREALQSVAPPREGPGGATRGDDTISGPIENTGLAGDDDTPGYGRGGRGGR